MHAQMQAASLRATGASWSPEEVAYADKLICEFIAGRLPLPNATSMLTFLATALNCDDMRVTTRFASTYWGPRLQEHFVHKGHLPSEVQMELKLLEARFLAVTHAQQVAQAQAAAAAAGSGVAQGARFQNAAQKFRASSRDGMAAQGRDLASHAMLGAGADSTMDALSYGVGRMLSNDGGQPSFRMPSSASRDGLGMDSGGGPLGPRLDSLGSIGDEFSVSAAFLFFCAPRKLAQPLAANSALPPHVPRSAQFDIDVDPLAFDSFAGDRRSRSQSGHVSSVSVPGQTAAAAAAAAVAALPPPPASGAAGAECGGFLLGQKLEENYY